jgi:hypothetical protein
MKYKIEVDQDNYFKFTTKLDLVFDNIIDALEHLNNKPAEFEQVVEQPSPLDNSSDGHPFDFFGGTSWSGKRSGFD